MDARAGIKPMAIALGEVGAHGGRDVRLTLRNRGVCAASLNYDVSARMGAVRLKPRTTASSNSLSELNKNE